MKTRYSRGPFMYAKACYHCGWYSSLTIIVSSLCEHCGQSTVVYCGGHIKYTIVKQGWFKKPIVTGVFEIEDTQNIDARRYLGLPVLNDSISNKQKE